MTVLQAVREEIASMAKPRLEAMTSTDSTKVFSPEGREVLENTLRVLKLDRAEREALVSELAGHMDQETQSILMKWPVPQLQGLKAAMEYWR